LPEIGYLNIKEEFYNIFTKLFKYMSSNEIAELLFFIENPKSDIKLSNPLLKQEVIADYRNLNYLQTNSVKDKIYFFYEVKEKNKIYANLLRNAFEDEMQKIKDFVNLQGLLMYITIVFLVIFMIMPVLLSVM
jgi:hypothetical protein